MDLRSGVISLADWMAVKSGAAQSLRLNYSGRGAALMFHRLQPAPRQELYHHIFFSEGGLIALLKHFLRSGVDVVDINEALRRLVSRDTRYFVVLTFDDGYRDNYTNVLPILREFGLPFTVFICSAVIERTLDYWWGGLLELFKSRDEVFLEPMGIRFRLRNRHDRESAFHRASSWVEADVASRSAQLASTFRRYGVSPTDLLDQDAMTERELRLLSESPYVTIGGHGSTHRPLAALTEPEVEWELAGNREHLERITGQPVEHFAYPHGDRAACDWRDAELVRRAGYRSAFTTRIGNLFPEHAVEPFMLPRGSMNPRREEAYHADAQFAGVHRFLKSRAGSPVNPETLPLSSKAQPVKP